METERKRKNKKNQKEEPTTTKTKVKALLTMVIFISKKQKALMRERRRRQKKNPKDEETIGERHDLEGNVGQKRKRDGSDDNDTNTHNNDDKGNGDSSAVGDDLAGLVVQQTRTIVVPAILSGKDLRKFRKEARRQARKDGIDDGMLRFIEPSGKDGTDRSEKRKKGSTRADTDESHRPQKKQRQKTDQPQQAKKSFPSIKAILREQQERELKEEEARKRKAADGSLPTEYKQKYLALDCEMVGIGTEGKKSALARVSLIDWDGKPVMDTFVKVPSRVTDFRTWVSGVEPKHIRGDNAIEPKECRERVAALLKNKILVGHALSNDLKALLMQHPKEDIRDTARYQPYQRFSGTKWRPRKLRDLAKQHLGLEIQQEGVSHDSVDDAKAAMELFKRAREDWEKELTSDLKRKSKKKKN